MTTEPELVCTDDRALLLVAAKLMEARARADDDVLLSTAFTGALPQQAWRGRGGVYRCRAVFRWPGIVRVYASSFGVLAESIPGHPLGLANRADEPAAARLLEKADEALRSPASWFVHRFSFAASGKPGAPPWHYECVFTYPGVMTVHQGGIRGPVVAVSLPGRPSEPDAAALQQSKQSR